MAFNPLYSLGEHHDPRPAAVPLPHVAAGPAEKAIDDLARRTGSPERIGERVPEGMEAGLRRLSACLDQEPAKPFLVEIAVPAAATAS